MLSLRRSTDIMRISQFIRVLILVTLFLPYLTQAKESSVHEFMLDNGMKVLVRPDHRAPVAITQVWYKVGSGNEHSGITGVSHVLEHMMFKGTETIPAGRFSEIVSENGGQKNAFTSRDYTAYYEYMGSDRLEIAFKLEADRMRNLKLLPEEFKKELEVVKEERFMRTEDNPESLTYERFNAVAFLNSPYHHPVIGWQEDLDTLKVEDLQKWYDMYYAPNNATLVVVGDVDPKAVLALAKQYFGPLKAGELPVAKLRAETPQRGERRIKIQAPAKVPYVLIGYSVPVLNTADDKWEPYALEVLAGILDGGASSRLTKNLIRKDEIAASTGVGYSLASRHQSLFLMEANPTEAHTIADVEAALKEQVTMLQTDLADPSELARVKAQVIANEVFQRDSVSHMANQLGMLETVGLGWKFVDEYEAKIAAVTAEQVRDVAKKYLIDKHKTVAELLPQEIKSSSDKPAKKETPAS